MTLGNAAKIIIFTGRALLSAAHVFIIYKTWAQRTHSSGLNLTIVARSIRAGGNDGISIEICAKNIPNISKVVTEWLRSAAFAKGPRSCYILAHLQACNVSYHRSTLCMVRLPTHSRRPADTPQQIVS